MMRILLKVVRTSLAWPAALGRECDNYLVPLTLTASCGCAASWRELKVNSAGLHTYFCNVRRYAVRW